MDYQDAGGSEASSRPPTLNDVKNICRHLNEKSVKYILIGGLAINYFGYTRATTDIDLLVESSAENPQETRLADLRVMLGGPLGSFADNRTNNKRGINYDRRRKID